MAEPLARGRSAFRLPRVEFDLAGVLLGTMWVVAYACLWPLLASVLGVAPMDVGTAARPATVPAAQVLRTAVLGDAHRLVDGLPGADALFGLLGYAGPLLRPSARDPRLPEAVPVDVAAWKSAAAALAIVLLWSIVGGALARVHAVRKARDLPVRFDDGLAFSLGNLRQFLQAPLFAAAAGALGVAAVLACGALTVVPFAGQALALVAQPLSIVAALFVLVVAVGLVLGFPMMTAAIAVERGGSLDAVSRTFSYVWTRPVPWGISTAVVLAVAGAIGAVTGWMMGVWQRLFATGASWLDASVAGAIPDAVRAAASYSAPPLPEGVGGSAAASVWVTWGLAAVTIALLHGFAVSYLVGGVVDVYFLLREEVDQVDPSEVFVEGATASLGEPVPGEPRDA